MTMFIEAKKVITKIGKKGFKITQIKALSCGDIKEKEYFDGSHCYADNNSQELIVQSKIIPGGEETKRIEKRLIFGRYETGFYGHQISLGHVYSEAEFDLLTYIIRQCGQNLKRLRANRKEMEKEWTGTIKLMF